MCATAIQALSRTSLLRRRLLQKQPPRKAEIGMPGLENLDLQVTGLESKHPVGLPD